VARASRTFRSGSFQPLAFFNIIVKASSWHVSMTANDCTRDSPRRECRHSTASGVSSPAFSRHNFTLLVSHGDGLVRRKLMPQSHTNPILRPTRRFTAPHMFALLHLPTLRRELLFFFG
jgi:hypothetical protein